MIHVLQVGSKPVTLSAARQLDSVDAAAIRPFGRVRIDPKPATGVIEVIGSVDGILARSSARAPRWVFFAPAAPEGVDPFSCWR